MTDAADVVLPQRVEVQWLDSEGDPGWRPLRDAERDHEEPLRLHYTCGYLIGDDDEAVTVALSYRPASDEVRASVCDTIKIPRVAIQAVRTVTVRR